MHRQLDVSAAPQRAQVDARVAELPPVPALVCTSRLYPTNVEQLTPGQRRMLEILGQGWECDEGMIVTDEGDGQFTIGELTYVSAFAIADEHGAEAPELEHRRADHRGAARDPARTTGAPVRFLTNRAWHVDCGRSPHMRRLASLLLLLVPACLGPEPNADLADLPGLRPSVQTKDASDYEPTSGWVYLGYSEESFAASHDGECAVLGRSVEGRLGDAELDLSSRGSNDEEFGGCYLPMLDFETRFAADQPTLFTVSDDSLTVEGEFPAGTFAPHTPTLRSPSEWSFRGGERVRVGWSHPEDFVGLDGDPFTVHFHIGPFGEPNDRGDNVFPLNAQFVGDEIQFTIPSPPPITGPGIIGFRFGYSVGATTCGEGICELSASRSFSHRVTITN